MRPAIAGILLSFITLAPAVAQEPSNTAFVEHFRGIDQERWRPSDGWSSGDWFSTFS